MPMRGLDEIDREIQSRKAYISPLVRQIEELERERVEVASRQFIASHAITMDDVELSRQGYFEIGRAHV